MDAAVRILALLGLVGVVTVAGTPSGERGSRWPDLAAQCQRGVTEDTARLYRFHDHTDVVEAFSGTRALPASVDGMDDERLPCVELK